MATEPLLFDLGQQRPTTRQIALSVKESGVEGLPDAAVRGDDTRYQEVRCRSALNRVEGMPFRWTLNPYRGCTHGCHYCFARRYHSQFELGSGDDFASVILVKANFADVLRSELNRPSFFLRSIRQMVRVPLQSDVRLGHRSFPRLLSGKQLGRERGRHGLLQD